MEIDLEWVGGDENRGDRNEIVLAFLSGLNSALVIARARTWHAAQCVICALWPAPEQSLQSAEGKGAGLTFNPLKRGRINT